LHYAEQHHLDIEFFQSNSEGSVIDRLYAAHDDGDVDGAIINPGGTIYLIQPLFFYLSIYLSMLFLVAGFTKGYRALGLACGQVHYPVVEVHISNTAAGGTISEVTPNCKATVQGFGIYGYNMALAGLASFLLHNNTKP
jgi:3-dehydroquinate dehydratase-2